MKLRFRAWNGERYIYSFTSSGIDRLGWFFANMKGYPIEQQVNRDYYVPVETNYEKRKEKP